MDLEHRTDFVFGAVNFAREVGRPTAPLGSVLDVHAVAKLSRGSQLHCRNLDGVTEVAKILAKRGSLRRGPSMNGSVYLLTFQS